jgi:hypothetical protein
MDYLSLRRVEERVTVTDQVTLVKTEIIRDMPSTYRFSDP